MLIDSNHQQSTFQKLQRDYLSRKKRNGQTDVSISKPGVGTFDDALPRPKGGQVV